MVESTSSSAAPLLPCEFIGIDNRILKRIRAISTTHNLLTCMLQELRDELDTCTTSHGDMVEYSCNKNVNNTRLQPDPLELPYNQHGCNMMPELDRNFSFHHYCIPTNSEILNALRKIIERYDRDDTEGEQIYEWRQVALGVDRLLFWIFLFGTLSSTIIVLIIAPVTKWL